MALSSQSIESIRLNEDSNRLKNWKRWGPYLSERQWSTVREDYSEDGSWYSLISQNIVGFFFFLVSHF